MGRAIYLCALHVGHFTVRSASGKQGVDFEDSNQFGPSFVDMRSGDVRPVPDKHWFWKFYQPWLEAGRPTDGTPQSTPTGPLQSAVWAKAAPNPEPSTPERK